MTEIPLKAAYNIKEPTLERESGPVRRVLHESARGIDSDHSAQFTQADLCRDILPLAKFYIARERIILRTRLLWWLLDEMESTD